MKKRERAGVAILVSNKLYKHIERIEPAGSRLMRIRLKCHKRLVIIIAYAPPANKHIEEKDQFYEQLKKMIEDTPKNNALIIAGDFNAKAMKPNTDTEATIIGKHAVYHPESEKGMAEETLVNRERLVKLGL